MQLGWNFNISQSVTICATLLGQKFWLWPNNLLAWIGVFHLPKKGNNFGSKCNNFGSKWSYLQYKTKVVIMLMTLLISIIVYPGFDSTCHLLALVYPRFFRMVTRGDHYAIWRSLSAFDRKCRLWVDLFCSPWEVLEHFWKKGLILEANLARS